MRLKEIKPGMVIHCKTKEEMEELSKHKEFPVSVEHIWNYGNDRIRRDCIYFGDKGTYSSFCNYDYYAKELRLIITEFSDLILPELTAKEAIKTYAEICIGRNCDMCPINVIRKGYSSCNKLCFEQPEKVVKFLEQWKSEHEKKEPEIETVDICRIIEIQPDGIKRCVHEEDLASGSTDAEIKIMVEAELKRYCMEHDGEFIAVHEVVSMVKR